MSLYFHNLDRYNQIMKALFPILYFIFIGTVLLLEESMACNPPTSPSEVNLFLDLNASWREVAVAKEEACLQGKALRVIPDWSRREEYSRYAESHAKEQIRYDQCSSDTCRQRHEHNLIKYNHQMELLADDFLGAETLEQELDKLEREYPNLDVGRLIISGHDGGGHFSGKNGDLTRKQILDQFQNRPRLRESIQSLYLLGCYTGTTQELSLWNGIFPNASFVSGYEGQAPLNFRTKGLEYLRSSLQRESSILEAKSKEEIIQSLKQIEHIRSGFTGLRINCPGILDEAGKSLELNAFGLPEDNGDFIREDPSAGCTGTQFETMHSEYMKYYFGELEIPMSTGASSPVRGIYNFASSNAHCMEYQDEFKIPKGAAFGLNFFHAIKENSLHSSGIKKESLKDQGELDLKTLYDEYVKFNQKENSSPERSMAKDLFSELLKGHTGESLTRDEMWNIVDKVEASMKAYPTDKGEEFKQVLADTLKVAIWNSTGEPFIISELMERISPSQQKPLLNRDEFDRKYGNITRSLNEDQKKFYDTLPDASSSLYTQEGPSEKKLIDASRKEIMRDFHLRKIKTDNLYWKIQSDIINHLNQDQDPFANEIFKKVTQHTEQMLNTLQGHQNGVVDLNCVPFAWHERLGADDRKLGRGDPCSLPLME